MGFPVQGFTSGELDLLRRLLLSTIMEGSWFLSCLARSSSGRMRFVVDRPSVRPRIINPPGPAGLMIELVPTAAESAAAVVVGIVTSRGRIGALSTSLPLPSSAYSICAVMSWWCLWDAAVIPAVDDVRDFDSLPPLAGGWGAGTGGSVVDGASETRRS